MFTSTVRVVGKEIVDAKLLAAAPRILATNRALVTEMLKGVQEATVAATPLGPAHFGYHGRERISTEVRSEGTVTTGKLTAPVQLYWREYGTRGHFRNRRSPLRAYVAAIGGSGTGGERAYLVASKALNELRRIIRFYYGAGWWNGR